MSWLDDLFSSITGATEDFGAAMDGVRDSIGLEPLAELTRPRPVSGIKVSETSLPFPSEELNIGSPGIVFAPSSRDLEAEAKAEEQLRQQKILGSIRGSFNVNDLNPGAVAYNGDLDSTIGGALEPLIGGLSSFLTGLTTKGASQDSLVQEMVGKMPQRDGASPLAQLLQGLAQYGGEWAPQGEPDLSGTREREAEEEALLQMLNQQSSEGRAQRVAQEDEVQARLKALKSVSSPGTLSFAAKGNSVEGDFEEARAEDPRGSFSRTNVPLAEQSMTRKLQALGLDSRQAQAIAENADAQDARAIIKQLAQRQAMGRGEKIQSALSEYSKNVAKAQQPDKVMSALILQLQNAGMSEAEIRQALQSAIASIPSKKK